jgi:hypothetical protein
MTDLEQLDRAEHGVEVAGLGRQIGERVVGEPDLEVEVESVGSTAPESQCRGRGTDGSDRMAAQSTRRFAGNDRP